ncbi:hypothetical protein CBR_g42075 [Chara braunii]|uniref:Uncharacterized protein n=1 Tax=Chara braunii TaxID=69332 RepID=A0A388LWZ8_CHABU|nr:hypothetical protein CBR_g42075 [Chara braunii]|eukprot:GBG86791.1 hypothetical protein CBR_g42075 [Chara braunii]
MANARYIPPTPLATARTEERLREFVGICYMQGVCPDDASLGEVIEDAEGKRFVVNGQVNAVKEVWLKDHTVIVTFQGGARHLSRQVKEDLIRAYEDGWFVRRLFGPGAERGRVKFEGANVASYVARSEQITTWLLQQKELKIKLQDAEEYVVTFKPWLPLQELKAMKLQEAEMKFWIMALRVPLDGYYYLRSTVQGMFGDVLLMHPPEYDSSRPKLMNVKFDMSPEVREKVDNVLTIESPSGERWIVEIATPYTDWCKRCKWYFHTEVNCPRIRQGEERGGSQIAGSGGHKVRLTQYQQRQERQERQAGSHAANMGEATASQPAAAVNRPQAQEPRWSDQVGTRDRFMWSSQEARSGDRSRQGEQSGHPVREQGQNSQGAGREPRGMILEEGQGVRDHVYHGCC